MRKPLQYIYKLNPKRTREKIRKKNKSKCGIISVNPVEFWENYSDLSKLVGEGSLFDFSPAVLWFCFPVLPLTG